LFRIPPYAAILAAPSPRLQGASRYEQQEAWNGPSIIDEAKHEGL